MLDATICVAVASALPSAVRGACFTVSVLVRAGVAADKASEATDAGLWEKNAYVRVTLTTCLQKVKERTGK